MLTHDNLIFASKSERDNDKMEKGKEVIISYLPLSHMAAQIIDFYTCLSSAGTIFFAEKDALKGSLFRTLKHVRPTRFFGVPRVFEKLQEKVMEIEKNQSFLQSHKAALGFDRCLTFRTGAAPLSEDVKNYFLSLDIPVGEVYGLSESTAGHSFSEIGCPHLSSVGKGLLFAKSRIDQPNANGEGELQVKGRHVMMGYLDEVEMTHATITDDGWLRTGDIARIDDDGNIFITGRMKEIIVTSGGENIPPQHVESLVKKEIPVISNAFLIGDKRKYLTMLIALKTEMDSQTGHPLDDLAQETVEWLEKLNVKYKKLSQILSVSSEGCPVVNRAIEAGIKRANLKAISNPQKVQKFSLIPDFSAPTGELTPTLKLKRKHVLEKYSEIIEKMYQ